MRGMGCGGVGEVLGVLMVRESRWERGVLHGAGVMGMEKES